MICRGCYKDKQENEFDYRKDTKKLRPYCKLCSRNISRARYANHKRSSYFLHKSTRARSRSQSLKVPFDLDAEYLESIWTDTCPILGVPISRDLPRGNPNAAELDRFIPEKGYVKGNVHFMSRRANRVKQDFSLLEMRQLIKWMEEQECK